MTKLFSNIFGSVKAKNPLLCLAAGRSGGHILPAIQLAKKWLQQHPSGRVAAYCSHKKLDAKIYAQQSIVSKIYPIKLVPFSLRKFWLLPLLALQTCYHTVKTVVRFMRNRPAEVISTGGIEALPVCIAARILRIPITLYELNVEPGKAIKFLAPLATTIHMVFNETQKYFSGYTNKCFKAAYPMRFAKKQVLPTQGEDSLKKTLFILGGSQGSLFLNTLTQKLVTSNKSFGKIFEIIHQVGARDISKWKQFYTQHGVQATVFDFSSTIEKHYTAADVVISRAGAGTLFELLFFEKRSIIIPLRTASTHHQMANAAAMADEHPALFTTFRQTDIDKMKNQLEKMLLKR